MTFWELLSIIVGSGLAAAVINKLGDIWLARKQRADVVEDKEEANKKKEKEKEEQRQEVAGENLKRLTALETIVKGLVEMQKALTAAQLAGISERLYYLCRVYLKKQKIHYEERRRLVALRDAYVNLGGKEDFDDLIRRIMALEVVFDGDNN